MPCVVTRHGGASLLLGEDRLRCPHLRQRGLRVKHWKHESRVSRAVEIQFYHIVSISVKEQRKNHQNQQHSFDIMTVNNASFKHDDIWQHSGLVSRILEHLYNKKIPQSCQQLCEAVPGYSGGLGQMLMLTCSQRQHDYHVLYFSVVG